MIFRYKNPSHTILLGVFFFSTLIFSACRDKETVTTPEEVKIDPAQNKVQFIETMQKHLDAVSNKDLEVLKSTMSPDGKMQLILPNSEIIHSADSFMDFHKEWFQDTTWTFETEILNTEIGEKYGMAITEIVYHEPERNGKPYFNRMTVSYVLEKINGQWYIIKDHASTIEKTKP